jgi:hypothetical protein
MNWFKGTKSQGIFTILPFRDKNGKMYFYLWKMYLTIFLLRRFFHLLRRKRLYFFRKQNFSKIICLFFNKEPKLFFFGNEKVHFVKNIPKLLKFIPKIIVHRFDMLDKSFFFSKVLLPILLGNPNITKLYYEISCAYVFSIKWNRNKIVIN